MSYDASKVDATMASYKTGYFTAKPEAWAEFNNTDGTLTFKYGVKPNSFDDGVTAYDVDLYEQDTDIDDESLYQGLVDYQPWAKNSESITKVVFDDSFAEARPTTCHGWFFYLFNLTSIEGLENLHTDYVTNMRRMFSYCAALQKLDLSSLNTENVTDMRWMFAECMYLSDLNLKGLNTSNVRMMRDMFYSCKSLQTIDLSYLDFSNVENMDFMFEGAGLTSISLKGFNTEKATSMYGLFRNCQDLVSADLSGLDTQNVTNFSSIFHYCYALQTVDMSEINTANVTDMSYLFRDCKELTTVYVGEKFSTANVISTLDLFGNCAKIVGATSFDSSKTGVSMANYKTGYFKTYYKIGDDLTELYGETLSVDKLNLTDGKNFVARAPFTAGAASYSRSMSSTSHWATLCLPYAVDASNVEDCQLYELKNVSSDLITLTQLEGSVAAGTPVLAYFNSINKSSLDVDASNVDVVTAPVEGTTADGYQLIGSFTETEVPDDGYIISKNKFWLTSDLKDNASATAVKTKGLRAWLKYSPKDEDEDEYDEAKAHVLGFAFDDEDETSAIEAVDALTEGKAEIYDIQGHRTDRLQKGLNIVKMGGVTKKVMVK